ncbi:MAG: dolichyl-diphosphooligosaccharide--protein glycosyltransferase subunit 1 [Caeruleum heppii]|nr:MAG: dolichyl-diphosphooligosaccharide--protein glycosyltransferase subunit 1 [Caeruleum heppii]
MKSISLALLTLLSPVLSAADSNLTQPLTSRTILPSTFKPPQVWKNVNLVRNINLDKSHPKEQINLIIENTDVKPQDEYFLPFEAGLIERVGGLEVRDKKDPEKGVFEAQIVEYDTYSPTQFYRIRLPAPLKPSTQQTLSISYSVLSALTPLPTAIAQDAKQYLVYTFSAYLPSAYTTLKQKTKLKLPSTDVPEYTILPKESNADGKEDPQRSGSTFEYGPYGSIPAGTVEPVKVRYEFTKPVLHVSLLERDLEVSHWGGNLATEERYWLQNTGANLTNHFSRLTWATSQYYNPTTTALRELRLPLKVGSANAYFTDDIGNVSTSRFRSSSREAMLEIKPRYPLFGGWKYSFRVGWNNELRRSLRKMATGEGYVLKVPFMEGPKQVEGVEYERVVVRVILPEGATDIQFSTPTPLISSTISHHRTFMDTLGRTSLTLTAMNLVDDMRDRELIVKYTYSPLAMFRKPLTVAAGMFVVFGTAWVVGRMDVRIGGKGVVA